MYIVVTIYLYHIKEIKVGVVCKIHAYEPPSEPLSADAPEMMLYVCVCVLQIHLCPTLWS